MPLDNTDRFKFDSRLKSTENQELDEPDNFHTSQKKIENFINNANKSMDIDIKSMNTKLELKTMVGSKVEEPDIDY